MLTLTVELAGGLGNQLFQLAGLIHISRRTKRIPYIQTVVNPSVHTHVNYFDTIFSKFRIMVSSRRPEWAVTETRLSYSGWASRFENYRNPTMLGYFQDWRYVDADFSSWLTFTDKTARYPGLKEGVFLHIRGGDYIGHLLHDVGLDMYYERAIELFPGKHFFLITNDLDYAQSKPFLRNIAYTVVQENELDTLYIMSQCGGGICANSTFSWWGAYLNPNRKIIMPDVWYNDPDMSTVGYYFPGVIKCPVLPPSVEVAEASFPLRDESEPHPT